MGPRSTVLCLLVCGISLCGPSARAQQQPATDHQPRFRSGVELVTVDVGVLDKLGQPLRGLTPGDFVVTVGGESRRVVTADFIDVNAVRSAQGQGADSAPISTNEGGGIGRLVVFAVDTNTLEPGDARQIAAASSRFFSTLTWADRSAFVSLPTGQSVSFTWAHDRVREALSRASGTGGMMTTWEYGSLSEARDIVTRGPFTAREIGMRECAGAMNASAAIGDPTTSPAGSGTSSPSGGGSSQGGDGSTTGTSGGSTAGRAAPRPPTGSPGDLGSDRCLREIQSSAEMAWGAARADSLASLTALRQVLAALARVPGDKTMILISGGWPMDEREQMSDLSPVAGDAAAARVTLYSFVLPHSDMSATHSRFVLTSSRDQFLYSWALENLTSMTGGRSFRADGAADGIFDRLAREMGSFYRLGIERSPADATSDHESLKVQVAKGGVTVRARRIFDAPAYEDRDWAARLASALESPAPATGVALRVTSYLAPDPDDSSHVRLVLTGDASRVQPGIATLQLLVRDLKGQNIVHGEQRLGEPNASSLPFATNVRVAPGTYIVRLAVIDGAGHVGSVDHRVDARAVPLGTLHVTGPLLVELPSGDQTRAHVSFDGVHRDERLAMQVGVDGDRATLADARVVFEIAETADGPALIQQPASLSRAGAAGDTLLAQAIADLRVLPPGQYLARVKVKTATAELGEVRRAFAVIEPAAVTTDNAVDAAVSPAHVSQPGISIRGRAVAAAHPFAVGDLLSPQVLNGFLDRVRARPDATLPAAALLLNQTRAKAVADLDVSDAQAAQTPVAAFLRGLSMLAKNELDPAANAFRSAMRAAPDFYPAMVYLGACYAAGGKDKEAAAVWRTALIKEGDAPAVHLMLGDALLRQGSADLALQTLVAARARWPEDDQLKQRFVLAALSAGRYSEALQTLDDLVARGAADEPSHALALFVLYESLTSGRSIDGTEQDRARMFRLADAYRAHGGPSLSLVDTWVKAVNAQAKR